MKYVLLPGLWDTDLISRETKGRFQKKKIQWNRTPFIPFIFSILY